MDFVAAWKASSIVLTGAFGILGLVKDFKDKKTNKVTAWGYTSLVGILVSTLFGVAAQLKETSDDAAKALLIARNNEKTLHEIERGFHRLEDPSVILLFEVPCERSQFKTFCKNINKRGASIESINGVEKKDWIGWPRGMGFLMEMNIFQDAEEAGRFAESPEFAKGHLSMIVAGAVDTPQERLSAIPNGDGRIEIKVVDRRPEIMNNDGTFTSLHDFKKATVVLSSLNTIFHDLRLTGFGIDTKDGQTVMGGQAFGNELEKKIGLIETAYIYTFN